jgi:glycosyltransferase involved in cell wall biosynthesis
MSTPLLFVDHASGMGGAENSLLLLLRHLPRERWQPALACSGGAVADAARAAGIETHPLSFPRLRRSPRFALDWFSTAQQLAALSRSLGAAALYANTTRAALYTALAARLARRPFIWHMRDFWLSESEPAFLVGDRFLKWLLLKMAAVTVVNSRAVQRQLPDSKKVNVVHNGLEIDEFDPALDGNSLREALGISSSAPVVGMVGRLRPWKGQERFLRVAQRVCEQIPGVRFLIVGGSPLGGDDSFRRHLEQMVVELGLEQAVVFSGHLADVRPALAAMDLFVHPGDPEPFGLVNIEAMAMEKVVVAFAHGALPEIVEHNVTGLLVEPENEAALAQAIVSLLEDEPRHAEMGRHGRRRVEEQFTMQRVASEIDHILDQIIPGMLRP